MYGCVCTHKQDVISLWRHKFSLCCVLPPHFWCDADCDCSLPSPWGRIWHVSVYTIFTPIRAANASRGICGPLWSIFGWVSYFLVVSSFSIWGLALFYSSRTCSHYPCSCSAPQHPLPHLNLHLEWSRFHFSFHCGGHKMSTSYSFVCERMYAG